MLNKVEKWWNNLPQSRKNDYEREVFGNGEWWEDNTLTKEDIVVIYNKVNSAQ